MNIFQEIFIFSQLCLICRGFDLTLLHVNDIHARFEETDKRSGVCEGMYLLIYFTYLGKHLL